MYGTNLSFHEVFTHSDYQFFKSSSVKGNMDVDKIFPSSSSFGLTVKGIEQSRGSITASPDTAESERAAADAVLRYIKANLNKV